MSHVYHDLLIAFWSSSISFASAKSIGGAGKKTKRVQFNKNVNIIHKLEDGSRRKMVSFGEKALADEPAPHQHDEDSAPVPDDEDGGEEDEDDDDDEGEEMEEDAEDPEEDEEEGEDGEEGEEDEEDEEEEEEEGEEKEALAGSGAEGPAEERKVEPAFLGDGSKEEQEQSGVSNHDAYLMDDLVKKTLRKTLPPPTTPASAAPNRQQQSNEVQQDSISSTMGSVSEDSLNTETEVLDYRIAEKIKTELEEKQKLERRAHTGGEELPTTSNFFDQCDQFEPPDEKPPVPAAPKKGLDRSRATGATDRPAHGGVRKRGRRAATAHDSANVDLHIEYEEQEYRPLPGAARGTSTADGGPSAEKAAFLGPAGRQLGLGPHGTAPAGRRPKGTGTAKNKVCTGCSIKHGADQCPLSTPLRAISNKIELTQWLEQNEDLIKKHKLFLKPPGTGDELDDEMDDQYDEDEDDDEDDVEDEEEDGGESSRGNGKVELTPSFSEVSVPPEFELRPCPQSSANGTIISSTTQSADALQLQKLGQLGDSQPPVSLPQQQQQQQQGQSHDLQQDQDSLLDSKSSLPPASTLAGFAGTLGADRETAPKSRPAGGHGLSIYTTTFIAKYTKLGPLTGQILRETEIQDDCTMRHIFETFDGAKSTYTSTENKNFSNWLRYIRPARNREQKNCVLQVHDGSIYFVTCRDLEPGAELLYWSNDSNSAWGKKKMEKTSK